MRFGVRFFAITCISFSERTERNRSRTEHRQTVDLSNRVEIRESK